jgi:hypothetical protein
MSLSIFTQGVGVFGGVNELPTLGFSSLSTAELVLRDRVKETSTTSGAGTLDLSGAVTGFEGFVSAVGNGNLCYYAVQDADGIAWEVGVGTVTDAATDTLSRTTILASSNTDSIVTLSAGTHTVFLTYPAEKSAYRNLNDQLVLTASGVIFNDSTVQTTAADSSNMGQNGTTRSLTNAISHSAGQVSTQGDRQYRRGVLRRQSTTNAFVSLTADNGTDSSSDTLQIPEDSAARVKWTVLGVIADGSKVAGYTVDAIVTRFSSTTSIAWSNVTADFETDATWDCQIITYSLGVTIQAKGAAGETVDWCSKLESVEVA